MLGDLQIEALAHGCARCGKQFKTNHRILPAYHTAAVRDFSLQVELGLIGTGVRNFFVHLDCEDYELQKGGTVLPSIHNCIRCHATLARADIIIPVFSIDDPRAVNPNDATDVGVALRDRIYFVHADCKNPQLVRESSNILMVK